MTHLAPKLSWIRRRPRLAALAAGVLLVAAAGCDAGSGAVEAAEGPAGTTRTTTYGREYLASTTTTPRPAPDTTAPTAPTTSSMGPQSPPPAPNPGPAPLTPLADGTTVERIVDGDTIVVAGGVRVRLIGMDTPETKDPGTGVECFGPQATGHMAGLLPAGTPVRLEYDVERTDQYGRTLAYVHRVSDALFVNVAMVRDGYAQVATYPPNVAHVDELVAAQAEARAAGRGLWSGCPIGDGTPTTTTTVAPPAGGGGTSGACDSSYPDVCIPPGPPDLDCDEISYRNFAVVGADPHRFDGNHDGVGCES